MLRRLHWLILRRLPGPFFGWLGILMFLLLMQFLIRWLPEIAGKGIPVLVIMELIAYNLAYMLTLAVPMSVLLAALMAFGDLAESQYYTVIKSTGISFGEIVWPAMGAAMIVFGGLLYFNTFMLPEANFRARQLWSDIRDKRPGFELQPGVFYDGVEDYSILVEDRPEGTNTLLNVTIYDYTEGRDQQAVIRAERGRIQSSAGGARLTLVLRNGEMHRPLSPALGSLESRYERLQFDRHVIHFNLSDVVFRRSSSDDESRSTRTTPLPGLLRRVDSLRATLEDDYTDLYETLNRDLFPDSSHLAAAPPDSVPDSTQASRPPSTASTRFTALAGLSSSTQIRVTNEGFQRARSVQSRIQNAQRDTNWQGHRLRSYQVEIHKKFSIALACIIFMVIGAPLGLALRRGGLATIGVIALGIFMFYWVTLVQGEKLSERGFFPPWLGMWIANVVMSGAGVWLILYVVLDLGATPPLRDRLWAWLTTEDA
jgi:lipopolysaccharide export system permease protein